VKNQVKILTGKTIGHLHQGLDIFITNRHKFGGDNAFLQPPGCIQNDISARVPMELSKVFSANTIEIRRAILHPAFVQLV